MYSSELMETLFYDRGVGRDRERPDRETKKIYFTGKCFIVIFELCTHKNGLKTGSYVIIYGVDGVFQKLSVKSGMERI